VTALPFREGDRVSAGAVVAALDDAALKSNVAAAEAAAHAAERDLARVEALLAKGAATPREAEDGRTRAAAAGAALAAARDDLAYAVLRAPFAGTVAARPVDVGDVVQPGATLLEIEGDDGLELRATVEAALLPGLARGAVLPAIVDGQDGRLDARVSAVSTAGDPSTHRFEVRADLPAARGLRSGLFARLLVASGSASATRLLVPEEAVIARGGLSGVFVVADGTARLRWVAVGSTADGMTEVRAGVEAGERVALSPSALADGQAVAEAAESAGSR
jgi:RND family efflux transporter MFP subunit